MVKDRLKEFEEIRKKYNLPVRKASDTSITINVNDEKEKELLALLDEIGPLYKQIRVLHSQIVELHKNLHDDKHRQKLVHKINDVNAEAKNIFQTITKINNRIESNSAFTEHVAKIHHKALVTFFSNANIELLTIQAELKDSHKNYLKKELKITGQEVSEEELENLLDNSTEVFNQNLFKETKYAKQRLIDVKSRHDDIVKIEKSLLEVNELFQELAILVQSQSEKVDKIETYAFVAQEKAQNAKEQLKEAKEKQTKARKTKVCLICTGVILIIIIILIFYFSS